MGVFKVHKKLFSFLRENDYGFSSCCDDNQNLLFLWYYSSVQNYFDRH